jgi:enterochelin esterase family protein
MLGSLLIAPLSLLMQEVPESPRVSKLLADIAGGNETALEQFWSDVKAEGTPLYEPGGDPEHTLVTFLWRGAPGTRNVVVNLDAEENFADKQLVQLPDTDVWQRSYRLPSRAQLYYQLSPDDSLVPFEDEKDWSTRGKGFVADPLNPKGIVIGGTQHFSFAVLPDAPKPDAYTERPEVVKGSFEPGGRGAFSMHSQTLGDHRVWIYATPGLEPGEANLVLFLDGSGAWQLLPSVRMFDNLYHDGRIGPTLAVYTDSPDRERDLACSDAYLDFLVDELLPWVQEKYGVDLDARRTVVSGRSLGGLFAAYACLRRPDVFGNAMMQSPSLWWGAARDGENEWLTREFVRAERVAARFFVAPGLFETGRNGRTSISILFSSRHFRDVLQAKGYQVDYREVAGGHDPLNWEVSLPDAIELFLGLPK